MKNLGVFRFFLFGLLLFLMGSCASHLGMYHYTRLPSAVDSSQTLIYPVYIDKDYGEADQIEIANALDQWNYVLNGHAKFVIVSTTFDMDPSVLHDVISGRAFAILKITSHNPMVVTADHVVTDNEHLTRSYSLGFTPDVGVHTVYLVRDRIPSNEMVRGLMMHELGHALGAVHHPGGLMNPRYDAEMFQCVDYDTAVDVAKYNNWKVDTLNYCILGQAALDGKHSEKQLAVQALGKDQQSREPAIDVVGR